MKKTAVTLVIALAGMAVMTSRAAISPPQLQTPPGSAARGEQLVSSTGCLNCHAMNGKGGNGAPDLSVPSRTADTPSEFATSLWNHMPSMLSEFNRTQTPFPRLRTTEVADIFAYFYAKLYFSPRGDVARGMKAFTDKSCSGCHSEVLDTQRQQTFVDTWMDLKDPSAWAERMWNHATQMDSAMSNRGIRWPNLTDQNVTDLMMFLSTRAGTHSEAYEFTIGEPEQGRSVFDRSCSSCHSFGSPDKGQVDLLERSGPQTITGYVAAMWNHAPAMRRRGGSTPVLNEGRMPDLIAYLFSQRYFFEPGNPARGSRVYEDKACATCHSARRMETGAPDLTKAIDSYSPITLTSTAWSHGSSMLQSMNNQRIQWPEFKGKEMADLIAYLNSRLIVRIAPATPEQK